MPKKSTYSAVIKHLLEHTGSEDISCKAKSNDDEIYLGFPAKFWDDEKIHLCIEKFIKEHNRLPGPKEFDTCPYLPSHIVIKHHYKMSILEWLIQEYPGYKLAPTTVKRLNYTRMVASDFSDIFYEEFKRIRPTSAEMYNLNRSSFTPTWQYIARRCGIKTWTSLKEFSGVNSLPPIDNSTKFTVIRHIKNLTD